jgi:hypothetical protein
MNETLRPMTLGDILDRTTQLYRRNFWTFAGVSAVPMGAMIGLFVVLGGLFTVFTVVRYSPNNLLAGVLAIVLVVVMLPLLLTVSVFSQGSLTYTAARVHLGEKPKIKEALKSVWPRFGRYLWLLILQALFVGVLPCLISGGFYALVLFGVTKVFPFNDPDPVAIFLLIALSIVIGVVIVLQLLTYAISFAVCVVEEKPAWPSLRRAAKLSKGTRGRIFLMFLLVMFLAGAVQMAVYIPVVIVMLVVVAVSHGGPAAIATVIVAEILNVLVNFTLQTLMMPVYSIALVLFYYDQRVRMEGFDIEWMMQQAGLQPPPPSSEFALPAAPPFEAAASAGSLGEP